MSNKKIESRLKTDVVSRREILKMAGIGFPAILLAKSSAVARAEDFTAELKTNAFRPGMRYFPDSNKFLIANDKAGAPDKKGWYHHSLNVADTPDGLVCVYRKTDSHTGIISDIMACRSVDKGRTWTNHKLVSRSDVWNTRGCWVAPQMSKLRDGRLVIVSDFGNRSPGQDHPVLAIWQRPPRGMSNHLFWSADNGKTWSAPVKCDDIGGEPGYIVELADGTLVYTRVEGAESERVWNPPAPWNKIYYRGVAVFSDDKGKTWNRTAVISDDPHQSDCEIGIVELAPGKLLAVSRIGFGGSGFRQPSRFIYSGDNGRTWDDKRLSPIYGHRPIIRKLQSGNLLVTYRNQWGTPGSYAAVFSPDETLKYEPAVFIWDESRCRIESKAMVLDTREGRTSGVIFGLYPAQAPDSRVEITAELQVERAAANAVCVSAGCHIRFLPNRVELVDRPEDGFAVDAGKFQTYRIVRENGKILIFVNGELKLEKSTDKIENRIVGFGNRQVRGWFGSHDNPNKNNEEKIVLENAGLSRWRSFAAKVENKTDHSIDWSWNAGEGFPDPFRRNNAVCLDRNASFIAGDSGYSGWTQMRDGTIVIADYTVGNPAADIPFARAYITTEKDLLSRQGE